jgi:hypothetical protein
MARIRWNTDVNAPCPGEIVLLFKNGRPTKETILVQTDWDYPGVARTFGWDMTSVQPETPPLGCRSCDHSGTDGTVMCPECGLTATDFISAAYDWLIENDGVTAEDPGYFS